MDPRHRPVRIAKGLPGLLAACIGLSAQAQPSTLIYTCTTPDGRHVTSDRPIAECLSREQRILNRDGSLRAVLAPPMTASERAANEAQERRAARERMARVEARRLDRNLLARYPDEAAHHQARAAALDTAKDGLKASEERLQALALDRRKLLDEAEFYKGKRLPPALQQALDANGAATVAQRQLVQTQQAEIERINRRYDVEFERLRKLHAGAEPGSLGPLETSVADATAEAGVSPKASSARAR